MMKFIKPFYGCRDGEVYPVHFQPGDECPPELEAAAIEEGAVEIAKPQKESNATRKPRNSA